MRATGPLFARVQSDLPLVRRYFLIVTEILLLTLLPLMLGLALVAPEALEVILEPKWLAATGPLQWLAVYMTLRPLATLAEQVLISQRQTRFTMQMSVLTFILMPVAFYVTALWYGPSGVAASWLVLTPVVILPVLIKVLRTIQLSTAEFLGAMWPAVAGAIVMVPSVLLLRSWLLSQAWPVAMVLALEVMGGGLIYAAVLLGFFRNRLTRYIRFAKDLRGPAPL
jgi:PST family polysaccharide transporter